MGNIKDSGNRTKFETGAVRDIQEGKGRCDLLPLKTISILLDGKSGNHVLNNIEKFNKTKDPNFLINAVRHFIDECKEFDKNRYTAMLEYACHMEDGAIKYGERNWEKGIPVERYIDSGLRHYFKYKRGDKDERHDRAFVWNMLCAHYTIINDLNNVNKNEAV